MEEEPNAPEMGAPDSWKKHRIFLDLGGDEGFIDEDGEAVPLPLEEVTDRGIVVFQKYDDGVKALTFYPWRSILRVVYAEG